MNHGLNNDFLCTACKIDVTFKDDIGKEINSSGTAFFMKDKADELCLITNRHVVDIRYKDTTGKYKMFELSQIILHVKDKDPKTGLPTIDDRLWLPNVMGFAFHPTIENDIACMKNLHVQSLTGKVPKVQYWIPFDFLATKEDLDTKIVVCDLVAFPGFPDWYDKRNNLPILRTGTIASDPRFHYSFSGGFDGACIAYEAFSYGGSSGSPVFAIQKGIKVGAGLSGGGFREIKLIGINAGHLPIQGLSQGHSGISYMYKSTCIIDLLE